MAQQFSLPQKRVLEDLDGEGYSWLTDWRAPGSPWSGLPWGTLSSPYPGLHRGMPSKRQGWGPAGEHGSHCAAGPRSQHLPCRAQCRAWEGCVGG